MPIPDLNENGHLPNGIHECTLDEIRNTFGTFQGTSQRSMLFQLFEEYVNELKKANIAKYLIINGSFTTSKETPNDIDMFLLIKKDFDFKTPFPPFQYNTLSKKVVRKKYRGYFDFYPGIEGDGTENYFLKLFFKVKGKPDLSKGVLKLVL